MYKPWAAAAGAAVAAAAAAAGAAAAELVQLLHQHWDNNKEILSGLFKTSTIEFLLI